MVENGMLSGAAQFYDDRAARADERAAAARRQAHLAQTMTEQLLDAVRRCQNPPLVRSGDRTTTAADVLCEMYGPEQDLFYEACCLTYAGQFEAGSKALLRFVNTVARRFGENAAEQLLEED